MNHKLLPSGRVAYHPMCNHLGDGRFESLLSGERTQVNVRRKVVDATYYSPSMPPRTAAFEVGEGVRLVPPNALPQLWHRQSKGGLPRRFVILGAGKTAMDAAVWLLQPGADPDAIQWVVPRDSWLINRITTQPGPSSSSRPSAARPTRWRPSPGHLGPTTCSCGWKPAARCCASTPSRTPTMFHLATVSPGEVEVLRRIRRSSGWAACSARAGRDGAGPGHAAGGARHAVHRLHRLGGGRAWPAGRSPSSRAAASCCSWCGCRSRPSARR
jgi:hypothetical protein